MVKLFCILNAFNRFDQKRVKTSNPLPSRWLSVLSVLWFFFPFLFSNNVFYPIKELETHEILCCSIGLNYKGLVCPKESCLSTDQNFLMESDQVHYRNIQVKFSWNQVNGFREEFKGFIINMSYNKNKSRPKDPCFNPFPNNKFKTLPSWKRLQKTILNLIKWLKVL